MVSAQYLCIRVGSWDVGTTELLVCVFSACLGPSLGSVRARERERERERQRERRERQRERERDRERETER